MTKEEMLEKLYEIISDKKLRMGCRIQYIGNSVSSWHEKLKIFHKTEFCERNKRNFYYLGAIGQHWEVGMDDEEMKKSIKIIGNAISLGRILYWIGENIPKNYSWFDFDGEPSEITICDNGYKITKITHIPWNLSEEFLEDQSDKTIKALYDFVKLILKK